MSVGFGFSVGDVVAIIGVIKSSVTAFSETKGASIEFKNLVEELYSLEGSLEAIERLQLNSLQSHQAVAIQKAVERCHRHIDAFVREIAKYQPWLTPKSKGTKASVGKIKWALCKKNDIVRFRDQMARQKSTIQILLLAGQANQTYRIEKNQKTSMEMITTASLVSDHTHKEILAIDAGVNKLSVQCSTAQKDNQKAMEQLYQQFEQFRAMIQMHQELPPQILLQKPVILNDACGKVYPFHLEFVTCLDALIAVLKIRFQEQVTYRGIQKLDRREFVFREPKGNMRSRDVSLRETWESMFKPGQRIEMAMIWPLQSSTNTCPYCLTENESANGCIEW